MSTLCVPCVDGTRLHCGSLVTMVFRVRKWTPRLGTDRAVHPSTPNQPFQSHIVSVVSRLRRGTEHCAATPGMRQSKLFIGRNSDNLSKDLLALDRRQCYHSYSLEELPPQPKILSYHKWMQVIMVS